MSINIPNSHPIFALTPQVQEASQSFFDQHGFNYFQYLRVYHDGSIGCLSNTTRLFEIINASTVDEPVVYSSFEGESSPNYWFLWDESMQAPLSVLFCSYSF